MQVRRIDPQGVKNPHVTLQSVLCYLWFYIQERIQLTLDHIECIYRKKKSVYKWTYTVQVVLFKGHLYILFRRSVESVSSSLAPWRNMFFVKVEPEEVKKGNEKRGNCSNVVYNKRYIFGLHPHFWHRAPKNLEFPVMRAVKVSFVMLVRWCFGSHPRMGAQCQENQPFD